MSKLPGYRGEGPGKQEAASLIFFDRKLAVGFGALVSLLMIIVSLAGADAYRRISEANEDLLTSALTGVLAESLSRSSFSGRYHTRLLLEEIVETHPQLDYVYIADLSNSIFAHSDPNRNDTLLANSLIPIAAQVLEDKQPVIERRQSATAQIQEIIMPYYAGYQRQVEGVIVVGISLDSMAASTTTALFSMGLLIGILTVVSLIATYLMSTFLAAPVRRMAYKLQGILNHAPVYIGIYDKEGQLEQTSASTEALLDPKAAFQWPFLPQFNGTPGLNNSSHIEESHFKLGAESRIAAVTTFPILHNRRDEIELLCSIAMDITEQRKAEEALREHRDRLEEMVYERTRALEGAYETIREREGEVIQLSQLRESLLSDLSFSKKCHHITDATNQLLQATFTGLWVVPATGNTPDPGATEEDGQNPLPSQQLMLEAYSTTNTEVPAEIGQPSWAGNATIRRVSQADAPRLVTIDLSGQPEEDWGFPRDLSAFIGYRLTDTHGNLTGVLAAYSTTPFSARQESILEDLSTTAAYVIQSQHASIELAIVNESLIRQERLATLGQLTATVSHELRNPLGTVSASFFSIGRSLSGAEDEKIRRAIARGNRGIARCAKIIDELLDFTRTTTLQPERTRLDAWIQEELGAYTLPEGIELSMALAPNLMVSIDRQAVYQCLVNLLNNARDALTEVPEGRDRHIHVELAREGQEIRITVGDTGLGLRKEYRQHLYEPLVSTKGFGTGLGLALVQKLMTLHGGRVDLESTENEGTRASLYVPAGDCPDDTTTQTPPP